jgi:hypothetical protein
VQIDQSSRKVKAEILDGLEQHNEAGDLRESETLRSASPPAALSVAAGPLRALR